MNTIVALPIVAAVSTAAPALPLSQDPALVEAVQDLAVCDRAINQMLRDLGDVAEERDDFKALQERRNENIATLIEHPATSMDGYRAKASALQLRDLIGDYDQHQQVAVSLADDLTGKCPLMADDPNPTITRALPIKDRSATASLARAEQAVELLRTRYIRDGWKIDEEAAERALAYLRKYACGADDADEFQTCMHFFHGHGISIDWIFDGDIAGLICRCAAGSKRANRIATENMARIQ
jgi:hypothetical protein